MARSVLLQANLNHCRNAQDLLVASMARWEVRLAAISEPYRVLPDRNWLGDLTGTAVLLHSPARSSPHFSPLDRQRGFVVASVYASPNAPLADFEGLLDRLTASLANYGGRHLLILGDLNAKSPLWGSPRLDARGRLVVDWSAALGLTVVNRGRRHTCVRQRGGSIVDLGFASPSAVGRIHRGVETLSDHRYIMMEVGASDPIVDGRRGTTHQRLRWMLSSLDREQLQAAAVVSSWTSACRAGARDPDEEAMRLRRDLTAVCDAGMRRQSGFCLQGGVH